MWERIRKPYVFESGGPNGGIYKSTNGGETWTKLDGGLPIGPRRQDRPHDSPEATRGS